MSRLDPPALAGRLRNDPLALAALAVATVATAGSLYYQYGMGLFPCELCWFQRILMYPLVVILAHGVATGDEHLHRLVAPFSVGGIAVAGYHSYIQLSPSATCSTFACSTVEYQLFGLLSIPNQALLAFVGITALLALRWRG